MLDGELRTRSKLVAILGTRLSCSLSESVSARGRKAANRRRTAFPRTGCQLDECLQPNSAGSAFLACGALVVSPIVVIAASTWMIVHFALDDINDGPVTVGRRARPTTTFSSLAPPDLVIPALALARSVV